MLYFNTITSHKLGFMIKMRGRTASYDKRLRRYEINKKKSIFLKNKPFYSLSVLEEYAKVKLSQ